MYSCVNIYMSTAKREFWVRLKAYNPRRGYKLRSFMAFGLKFEEARSWYKVPEVIVRRNEDTREKEQINVIEYLSAVREDNNDTESPLAFEICTKEEALAADAAAKRAKEKAVALADSPNPVDFVSTEERSRPEPRSLAVDPAGKPKGKRGRPKKVKPEELDPESV